jgi:hypothetical protein
MREFFWTLYLNHLSRKRLRLERKTVANEIKIIESVDRYQKK